MENSYGRIGLIANHLLFGNSINKNTFFDIYFESCADDIRAMWLKASKSEFFNHKFEVEASIEEIRARTVERIGVLYDKKEITFETDQKLPLKKLSMMYVFAEYDKATTTRILVHAVLFIDSIQTLGTEKHMEAIHRAYDLTNYGCFAMTELGHGSNVLSLETTATYIHETREFEINSPTPTSAKWWIGAAGKTANVAVLFAQLIVGNKNKGVHAFYIPLRDNNHQPYPGVTLGDCGPKISLNAIDNGFILFTKYRVSYDSLLDKFSGIDQEGKFWSNIKSPEKRFAAMLAGLIRGRLAVISSSEICIRCSLGITYRYLSNFSSVSEDYSGKLINSQLNYTKVVPILANLVGIRCGLRYLLRTYSDNFKIFNNNPEGEALAEYHTLISALKPYSSWTSSESHETLQELCGQFGNYSQASIGRIKSNQDINITWEGDNTVLIQQVGKYVFKQVRHRFKGTEIHSKLFSDAIMTQDHFSRSKSKLDENCELNELLEGLRHKFNYFTYKSLEKLQENAQNSESLMDAWNKTQAFHIQEIGKSFSEYFLVILTLKFCEEIRVKCEKTANVLMKVLHVFALEKVIKGNNVMLEGFMEPRQSRYVKEKFLQVCFELKEVGLEIIESILPPDQLLYSDIGESGPNLIDRVFERACLF